MRLKTSYSAREVAALTGLSARQREQFVDVLLAVKTNLSRLK